MALIRMTRRSPASLTSSFIDELPDRIRQMLEGTLPFEPVQNVGWMPAMEIVEKKDFLLVTAELPGLGDKDVDVSVDEGVLTISGDKAEEKKEAEEESQFYLLERRYGSFRRSFTLPNAVDVDKITADFANGVLTVKLPKSEEVKAKGKKILIGSRK
ncbi:MAG TPA: Hsp20/alpha crystallin family protein [Gemmatimonadaceae bacterium]|nr:Hsp20/alpha crystallin family protein [Gemmatimonadaceae bacterium]